MQVSMFHIIQTTDWMSQQAAGNSKQLLTASWHIKKPATLLFKGLES
jgi:hypothetical protein